MFCTRYVCGRAAQQPHVADWLDRGDFVGYDAREGLPNLENTYPRWQLTGNVGLPKQYCCRIVVSKFQMYTIGD